MTPNCLLLFEIALGCAAYRALPIFRHIFPFGAGSHAVIWITLCRVVDVSAYRTYISVHSYPPFVYKLVVNRAIISRSNIFGADFLSCSSGRFKSIFLFPGLNQASLAQRLKHFFAGPAHRAFPVVRQVFKLSASGYFPFTVPSIRIINISAVRRLALIHFRRLRHLSSCSN